MAVLPRRKREGHEVVGHHEHRALINFRIATGLQNGQDESLKAELRQNMPERIWEIRLLHHVKAFGMKLRSSAPFNAILQDNDRC